MEYDLLLFTALFILGTFILLRSRCERYFIVFMIRTEHFTPVIKYIANISPQLWKFLADLAVVFSFGGLGAAYLSMYRKKSSNLDYILLFLSSAVVVLWWMDIVSGILLFLMAFISVRILSKLANITLDFIYSTFVVALIFVKVSYFILFFLGASKELPWYVAVVEGAFGIPPILIGMFIYHASMILFNNSELPGVSPIVPAVRDGQLGVTTPGYDMVFVPIVYAVIAFSVVLFSHEFAHGVLAQVHKIKIKSTGLITFGVIPIGAFVEPEERDIETRPSIEKMRVFSAGSFANLMVCLIGGLIMLSISLFLVSPEGVKVMSVLNNSPAQGILPSDTVIYQINSHEINSAASYVKTVSQLEIDEMVQVLTDKGVYVIPVGRHPENNQTPYLGLAVQNNIKTRYGLDMKHINFVWTALVWTILFNFNVALVNILPIAPFDGWRMLKELMHVFKISPATARKIVYAIVSLSMLLLFINALPLVNIIFDYFRRLFI